MLRIEDDIIEECVLNCEAVDSERVTELLLASLEGGLISVWKPETWKI